MIGTRTVVAIVLARGGSKELPDKPIISLSLNVLKLPEDPHARASGAVR